LANGYVGVIDDVTQKGLIQKWIAWEKEMNGETSAALDVALSIEDPLRRAEVLGAIVLHQIQLGREIFASDVFLAAHESVKKTSVGWIRAAALASLAEAMVSIQ
jgi:hypothetical protein